MSDEPPADHLARLDALLDDALELPVDERTAFLDRTCGGEPALRAEVEELLRLAVEPGPDLQPDELASGPLWAGLCHRLEGESVPSAVGERIGPWRLVRELGRGGMGTVYLAERDDREFEQVAAIKLVRPGADSEEIFRRFELERQILAALEHPNIARLLDGGRTEGGRPYFAMEYVEGEPIDVHCERRRLSIEERLRLFLSVGRAVEHAHRRLVVHRDLKPSNVVVTRSGAVKLLDFGIAKMLAPAAQGAAPLTRTVARVLTPEYASPEQIRGEPVATAADVYQLGLLLYELLTGARAHRFEDSSLTTWERVVCEKPVRRPSTVLAGVASGESHAMRPVDRRSARKLRGDLDNILLMALRKEPDRRYASAGELIDDIERHLRGLPVRARADTLLYRTSKLVHRHPFRVAASLAIAALLAAYGTTVTYQARRLAEERDRAEIEAQKALKVSSFLVGLFEAADPIRTRGDALTAGELVEAGIEQARSQLDDEPVVQAELLGVLGKVSLNLSQREQADGLLAEALALQRQLHPTDHPDLAAALVARAEILRLSNRTEEAIEHEREALAMRLRLHGEGHPEVAASRSSLGYTLAGAKQVEAGEALLRDAIAVYRALGPEDETPLAIALNRHGIVLRRLGRLEDSIATHRESLALRRRVFGADHPEVGTSLNNLASTLFAGGRFTEAEPRNREAVALTRKAVGDGHALLAIPLRNWGRALRFLGRLEEAEAVFLEELAIRRANSGEDGPSVAGTLTHLGRTLHDAGRLREAESRLREALAIAVASADPDDSWPTAPAIALGRLLAARGAFGEAEALLVEALSTRLSKDGEASPRTAEARVALGVALAASGRETEARPLLETGLERLRASLTAEPALLAAGEAALAQLVPRAPSEGTPGGSPTTGERSTDRQPAARSRRSQARARIQSRCTVRSDEPNASAVSFSVMPAK